MKDKKEFLLNYNNILQEITRTRKRGLRGFENIDSWDIIAAVFLAAIFTIGALGSGWIAYHIVIAISSGATLSTGMGFGISIMNWIKIKENRETTVKQLTLLLNSEMAEAIADTSKETIQNAHSKIKEKLKSAFDGDLIRFENYLKG